MKKTTTKTNTRGGARPGAGRKAADGAKKMVVVSASVTEEQRDKFKALGGSVWLRSKINHYLKK